MLGNRKKAGSDKKGRQTLRAPKNGMPCPGGCGGFTNGGKCGDCFDKDNPGWRQRLPR